VQRIVASGALDSVLAIDDGAAAHFVGAELARVVTSRPKAGAYRVSRSGGAAREEALAVQYVGPPAG
jgi:dipeptidase E